MNHLDEGTIHAWLDGAVDAPRAREIEAHVAECASCSAAVAEARGVVAASSRILSALDDVPAGVTARAASPRAPVRQWRAARWVTGIAAALMLAVGVTTWNRSAVRDEMQSVAPPRVQVPVSTPAAVAAPVIPPATGAGESQSTSPVPAAPLEGRRALNKTSVPRQRQAADLAAGVAAEAVTPSAVKKDAEPPTVTSLSQPAAAPSAKPATGAAAGAASVMDRRDTVRLRRLSEVVATSVGADAVSRSVEAEISGCYRLQAGDVGLLRRSAEVVGAVASTARRGAAPTATRAQAPAAAQADYTAVLPPALVRLDTLRHALGFIVRAQPSDSSVGWWRRYGADSVTIDLMAAGVFRLAVKDRVVCP